MMTFNDFVHKYKLKNKATSKIKNYQILCSIGLNNVRIHLRDGPFESDIGIVNLHPSKGTHWVLYIHECYFDSNACAPPKKFSKVIIKRNGHCLKSEYKILGLTNERDSYCACYCSYLIYLTKAVEIDFESAVLNLYYQMIKYC